MPDESGSAERTAAPTMGRRATARRVVLVTGISGAGRTSVLNILEDLGYEAIDNPPLDLLETIITAESDRPIAVGVDIRTRDFSVEPFVEHLEQVTKDPARQVSLLFIDCDDEVLSQRYSETRRRHPLAQGRPLADGIEAERRLVSPLRSRADLVIDTSGLKLADLRQVLTGHLGRDGDEDMAVVVTSFSFRHGLPRSADLVIDVRFLNNPYYEKDLRDFSGRDAAVAAFIAADAGFEPFFAQLTAMLGPLLPRYRREGKSYLTIALGCTGGRHRSVMVAERLAAWFHRQDCRVTLLHRDLEPASHDA